MIFNIFSKKKDGGPKSPVDAYFLIEVKGLFSVALLKFNKGCREQYHTHAFNAYTWFLKGELVEEDVGGSTYNYGLSMKPKLTPRAKNHRVKALKDSWCFTLRGPWESTWTEYDELLNETTTLTYGRDVVRSTKGIY